MTKNPIYCAIDTSCIDDADRIINEISPYIGGIKLGLEFFTSCGVKGIEKISKSIIESISILVEKKLDLFSSSVNNK